MPLRHITGDLFTVDADAIGHGVNLHGVMGSGIAPQFKKRWPVMYEQYRDMCRREALIPGGIFPYRPIGEGEPVIINMATQVAPGANASLDLIHAALIHAVDYCENEGLTTFAIPRIGAGIGGLAWEDVLAEIEEIAEETWVTIIVVSLPANT